MLKWLLRLLGLDGSFTRAALNLDDDQRQNLTTFSMIAGELSLLLGIGLLVWVLRYSWPADILSSHAGEIIDGFFKIIFGLLALVALQTAGKVAIAIGGKLKASAFGASVEADSESDK